MKCRRRNPELRDVTSLLQLGAFVGGALLFYKYVWPALNTIGTAGQKTVDTTTTAIANAIVGQSNIGVTGGIVFPDGTTVTMDTLAHTPGTALTDTSLTDGTPAATFMWRGQKWQIAGPGDESSNWYAQPVGASTASATDLFGNPILSPNTWS